MVVVQYQSFCINQSIDLTVKWKEEEISAEMYSFHEAAFRLQEMEEDVVDSHKILLNTLPRWQESVGSLFATTDRIDFDVEGLFLNCWLLKCRTFLNILNNSTPFTVYVQQMENALSEMADDVFRLKTKFAKFARELQEEDERSQAVKLINSRRPMGFANLCKWNIMWSSPSSLPFWIFMCILFTIYF